MVVLPPPKWIAGLAVDFNIITEEKYNEMLGQELLAEVSRLAEEAFQPTFPLAKRYELDLEHPFPIKPYEYKPSLSRGAVPAEDFTMTATEVCREARKLQDQMSEIALWRYYLSSLQEPAPDGLILQEPVPVKIPSTDYQFGFDNSINSDDVREILK